MIQVQVINKILQSKSMSLITDNSFDVTYFEGYTKEFMFLMDHYNNYRKVPDEVTFVGAFPNFPIIVVEEPDDYLKNALIENYRYNLSVKTVNRSVDLLREGDSKGFIDYFDSVLPQLTKQSTYSPYSFKKQAENRFNDYCARKENRSDFFITTGFKELDDITGGWDLNDELAVFVARPNVGKSWILLKSMLAAAQEGKLVGFYSGEMSETSVSFRLDTYISHLRNFHLSKGYSDVFDEYAKYIRDIPSLLKGDILMITPDMLGGFANKTSLASFVEREGIQMLGVDQFSLLSASAAKGANSWEVAKNVSMDLKILQSQKHIPIIVAAQQNRDKIENGPDTSLIAGSDRLGQDATTVIYLDKPKCETPVLSMEIIKGRNCKVGSKLQYTWDIDTGTFVYVENEEQSDKPNTTGVNNTYTQSGYQPPNTQSFDVYGGQGHTDF